jgi:hypothetical protein
MLQRDSNRETQYKKQVQKKHKERIGRRRKRRRKKKKEKTNLQQYYYSGKKKKHTIIIKSKKIKNFSITLIFHGEK